MKKFILVINHSKTQTGWTSLFFDDMNESLSEILNILIYAFPEERDRVYLGNSIKKFFTTKSDSDLNSFFIPFLQEQLDPIGEIINLETTESLLNEDNDLALEARLEFRSVNEDDFETEEEYFQYATRAIDPNEKEAFFKFIQYSFIKDRPN